MNIWFQWTGRGCTHLSVIGRPCAAFAASVSHLDHIYHDPGLHSWWLSAALNPTLSRYHTLTFNNMAPLRTPEQHQMLPTMGSSLAVRHGVQSTRPTAIAHELVCTYIPRNQPRSTGLMSHRTKPPWIFAPLPHSTTGIFQRCVIKYTILQPNTPWYSHRRTQLSWS